MQTRWQRSCSLAEQMQRCLPNNRPLKILGQVMSTCLAQMRKFLECMLHHWSAQNIWRYILGTGKVQGELIQSQVASISQW